jgi:peptidoglycan/LPS O-acetylase OafA/YrhL
VLCCSPPRECSSSLYLHNLIFGGFPGAVNTVAWSLEVEVQFYVLVPLLSLLFAIADARLRRGVIISVMLVAGFLSNPLYRSTHLHYSILYYVAFFLAGFLVVDLHLTRLE